jgi:hypothetical protein
MIPVFLAKHFRPSDRDHGTPGHPRARRAAHTSAPHPRLPHWAQPFGILVVLPVLTGSTGRSERGVTGILEDVTNRVVSPVFAGREAELAVLARAFDDAAGGSAGTVLAGAEAGGGKTQLVGEFAAALGDRAFVLTGGCVDLSAAGLPYAPFTAVLRQFARERGGAKLTELLGGYGAAEMAALLPELGAPPAGTDPETARARLFELLLRLIETVSERLPLVVVVADVHWPVEQAHAAVFAAEAARARGHSDLACWDAAATAWAAVSQPYPLARAAARRRRCCGGPRNSPPSVTDMR